MKTRPKNHTNQPNNFRFWEIVGYEFVIRSIENINSAWIANMFSSSLLMHSIVMNRAAAERRANKCCNGIWTMFVFRIQALRQPAQTKRKERIGRWGRPKHEIALFCRALWTKQTRTVNTWICMVSVTCSFFFVYVCISIPRTLFSLNMVRSSWVRFLNIYDVIKNSEKKSGQKICYIRLNSKNGFSASKRATVRRENEKHCRNGNMDWINPTPSAIRKKMTFICRW